MLKKANRLAKSKDISEVFARGRGFFNPFFSLKFLSRPNQLRFALVVSTKVHKTAVARNRLKRLMREYLRNNLLRFKNGDYIIVAKPKAGGLGETEMKKHFLDLLSRQK